MAINPLTQTLWTVAYGDKPTNKFPSKEEVLNKAADHIIRTHQGSDEVGKIFAALGSIILILGLVLAGIYGKALNYQPTHWNVSWFKVGLTTAPIGLGLAVIGGYYWFTGSKRFEEDKTKVLVAVSNSIGKDLAELKNERKDDENIFERNSLMEDAKILQNALAPYIKA